MGGFGGAGANAGDVTITSSYFTVAGIPCCASQGGVILPPASQTTLETDGDRSNGILAQSLGGGGGNGGFSAAGALSTGGAAIAASVGGFGLGGGNAGIVSVTSLQNILTKGNFSNGIAAQSIGGGGGNGGFSLGLAAGSEFAGNFSVGGFALSGGGNGAAVTVDSKGRVTTQGVSSNGILAQSIGGGGGDGGSSLSGSFSLGNAGISASVGGKGSNGGLAGAVVVTSNIGMASQFGASTTIETFGESANGIEAQSIGGGGGNGGFSGSFTATANANASLALSVGGFGAAGNKASTSP